MPPRSPFRFVAPLALVAAAVAVWLLVSPLTEESVAPSATTTAAATATEPKRRTYTVRRGDSLSSIAARYGLDVDALIELNPQADPQALRAGQRLRLRARE